MQFSAFIPLVVDTTGEDNQAIADEISKAMDAAYARAMDLVVNKVLERGKEVGHKLEPVIQGMFIVPGTTEGKYICTICLTAAARDITAEQMMQQHQMNQQQGNQPRRGIVIPELRGMQPKRR